MDAMWEEKVEENYYIQAKDGIRESVASRGLGNEYKRQASMSRRMFLSSSTTKIVSILARRLV